MKSKGLGTIAIVTALVSALGGSALSAQDKYTVKVPGGLAFTGTRKSWRRSPQRRCRARCMTSTLW